MPKTRVTPVSSSQRGNLAATILRILTYFRFPRAHPTNGSDPTSLSSWYADRDAGPSLDVHRIAFISFCRAFWDGMRRPEWWAALAPPRREEVVRQECGKLEKKGLLLKTAGSRAGGIEYRAFLVAEERRRLNDFLRSALTSVVNGLPDFEKALETIQTNSSAMKVAARGLEEDPLIDFSPLPAADGVIPAVERLARDLQRFHVIGPRMYSQLQTRIARYAGRTTDHCAMFPSQVDEQIEEYMSTDFLNRE